jgi:LPPG:FO 2-phospho-L-lactate transferase
VKEIIFQDAERAHPAPGVVEAIAAADGIVICPSNPLISIGPILAVPGIREAIQKRRERVVAMSPIVGGKSLKGPTDKMLAQLGYGVSALGVARLYRDLAGTFVIDERDEAQKSAIEALGMRVEICSTVMRSAAEKENLAREVTSVLGVGGRRV